MAFTAAGFLDGRTFPGELLSLFRVQYLAGALVLGAPSLRLVRRQSTASTCATSACSCGRSGETPSSAATSTPRRGQAPYQELRDGGRLERGDAWRPFDGTYPVWNRFLRVPIDQCLAGSALAVSVQRGPAIGSDHFPISVSVGPAPD